MRAPYTQLYVHLIWATWDRLPLITGEIEARLYAAIAQKCREFKCIPLAIGGMADHVHVLVRLNTAVAIATLVKEIKGASSHLVTHAITPDRFFKWQGSYGAFTLRKNEAQIVADYIHNQKQHHAAGELISEWEQVAIEVQAGEEED